MKPDFLGGLAAAALMLFGTAHAVPISYDYTGIVTQTVGSIGTAVSNTIVGSFTYDPDSYSYGSVIFTASTGTFTTTNFASFQVHDGNGWDEQFLEDVGPAQAGFFFGDLSATALTGNSIANLNFDLTAWTYHEVRYNEVAAGLITRGWTGNITSIIERSTSVPEPGTLALMGLGLAAIGSARRRRAKP